jgi:hypothetical protein
MKTLLTILVIASFLLLAGDAFGDVYALVMKDGTVTHWSRLIERDDRYCVTFPDGEACISKKDVIAFYKADNYAKLPPKKLVEPGSIKSLRLRDLSKQEIDDIVFAREADAKEKASANIKLKPVKPKKTETKTRKLSPGISSGSSSSKY